MSSNVIDLTPEEVRAGADAVASILREVAKWERVPDAVSAEQFVRLAVAAINDVRDPAPREGRTVQILGPAEQGATWRDPDGDFFRWDGVGSWQFSRGFNGKPVDGWHSLGMTVIGIQGVEFVEVRP